MPPFIQFFSLLLQNFQRTKFCTMKITVLGSGIRGMSCDALLAKNGFGVTLIEQNSSFGRKSGLICEEGFRFDTGPSLMTYPE